MRSNLIIIHNHDLERLVKSFEESRKQWVEWKEFLDIFLNEVYNALYKEFGHVMEITNTERDIDIRFCVSDHKNDWNIPPSFTCRIYPNQARVYIRTGGGFSIVDNDPIVVEYHDPAIVDRIVSAVGKLAIDYYKEHYKEMKTILLKLEEIMKLDL